MAKNNIFLSWSGKTSAMIAGVFYHNIATIINEATMFYSVDTLYKGAEWFNRITQELKDVKVGIVFLTKENITEPWIQFESGALYSMSSVCPLCCDLSVQELSQSKNPLNNLNATELSNKDDVYRMVVRVRDLLELNVTDKILHENFERQWPDINTRIRSIIDVKDELHKEVRDINLPIPNFLIGNWHLSYVSANGAGGEDLHIDSDGHYVLPREEGNVYYFQLVVVESGNNSLTVQKVQVRNGIVQKAVHSVETLRIENDKVIRGTDTFGNQIEYERR